MSRGTQDEFVKAGEMDGGLWTTLAAAVQAAVSVLFTIFWGALAGHFGVLDEQSAQKLSRLCVTMLLPALLVTSIGPELNPDSVAYYGAIFGWSLFYTLSTLMVSTWLKRLFRLPAWTVVATTFNSNTSMPLLLTQALATTGVIERLLASDSDTVSAAVNRAKSYFLANALCANVVMFAIGPMVLRESDPVPRTRDEILDPIEQRDDDPDDVQSPQAEGLSLLPNSSAGDHVDIQSRARVANKPQFLWLPSRLRPFCLSLYPIFNPVLAGGMIAVVFGLTPTLHRAFFNDYQSGGIFNAWFVTSIETIGNIFVGLQVLIVGERLSKSFQREPQNVGNGRLSWAGIMSTLVVRYIAWPLISLAVIYWVASRTPFISSDPMLPFTMMLMPCGPSAIKLAVLANVSESTPGEKMKLAKFLSISYALSPLLAFAVAGSFRVSEAIQKEH